MRTHPTTPKIDAKLNDLLAIAQERARLDEEITIRVRDLRRSHAQWNQIAPMLGVSMQAVAKKYGTAPR